jgi:hypothetical protein
MSSTHPQLPSSGPTIHETSLCYHDGGTTWRVTARRWKMDQLHCMQLVLRLQHEKRTATSVVSTTTCARASRLPNSVSRTPCSSTVTPPDPPSMTTLAPPIPSTLTSSPLSASPPLLTLATCLTWSNLVALVSNHTLLSRTRPQQQHPHQLWTTPG